MFSLTNPFDNSWFIKKKFTLINRVDDVNSSVRNDKGLRLETSA